MRVKRVSAWLVFITIIAVIALNFKIYKVQTISMSDAIVPGDYIIVMKSHLPLRFNRGDIVAFTKADDIQKTVFVKRIAALPGDTILSSETGLTIKDAQYPHDSVYDLVGFSNETSDKDSVYLNYLTKGNPIPSASFPDTNDYQIPVPKSSYFMIGDNYFNSMDSRFWGFIDQKQIIGKIVLMY